MKNNFISKKVFIFVSQKTNFFWLAFSCNLNPMARRFNSVQPS